MQGWAAWQGTCCVWSLHSEAIRVFIPALPRAQTCWQDLSPALESRGLVEAHTLSLCLPHFPQRPGTGYWWHLPVALPSPCSLAGGCGWHLYFFLLQLNSLNQSQELKPLKEPDAIWRAGLRAGISPPREHWFKEATPGQRFWPSCITPSLAQAKAVITSKSTRALPGLLLEKQCGESQVTFHSFHIGKRVCLSQQILPHHHFPCPGTALLSLAVHKPWAGPST